MKDNFFKGIVIGFLAYPIVKYIEPLTDSFESLLENIINTKSIPYAVEAQKAAKDLNTEDAEVHTNCIGFQYVPPEEEVETEEEEE